MTLLGRQWPENAYLLDADPHFPWQFKGGGANILLACCLESCLSNVLRHSELPLPHLHRWETSTPLPYRMAVEITCSAQILTYSIPSAIHHNMYFNSKAGSTATLQNCFGPGMVAGIFNPSIWGQRQADLL